MKQSIAAADSLYQAVCECYPNRPLFFLQLDEMYMELCSRSEYCANSFRKMVGERWLRYFPKAEWTENLERLADQYQRKCRRWVWSIVMHQRSITTNDLMSMQAILKVHENFIHGRYSRTESDAGQHEYQEWRIQTGGKSWNFSVMARHLKQSGYDDQLVRMIALYEKHAEKDDRKKLLKFAQEILMCMGIIAMQEPDEEETFGTIPEKIKRLWSDIMDQDLNESEVNNWIRDFLEQNRKIKRVPFFLMNIPYGQIRDTASKAMAQFHFCVVYAISCTKETCIDKQSIANNAIELYQNSFGLATQQQNIYKPIANIVERYGDQGKNGQIDTATFHYFQQHYDFVEDCFERIRKLDADCISSLQSEIEIRKIRAAEDIEMMYQIREDEAYGKLMETLSNPIHGNIIGQLYLYAAEKEKIDSVEEVRHLLNNLFLLMQQKTIMPVWDENSRYPGWSVRGKIVVKPVNSEEE